MEEREFRRLMADYEYESRHDPRRFAMATAAMAVLGYLAILGLLALSGLGLAWGYEQLAQGHIHFGVLMLMVISASMLVSLVRALWLRQHAPPGVPITARQAPQLFALIETVRRKSGAAKLHRVLIDDDLNAAILQQARLGLLGWHRNHLILGLPLLMGLDARQLAAVIAHEFGHLRGAHSMLSAWVYRTRRSWFELAQAREQARLSASLADVVLGFFFQHFFPRFNARAFVLSRQQEYEADRNAHAIAGPQVAAEALLATELQNRYLAQEFWPRIDRRAAGAGTPADQHPFREMRQSLRRSLEGPQAGVWLRDALKRLPDPTDTHPSLRDRLDFAEARARLPVVRLASAAETLLGDQLPEWIERMDRRWRDRVASEWLQRHQHLSRLRQLCDELAADHAHGALEADDHLMWARAMLALHGPQAEVQVLRDLLRDHPGHLAARYQLGLTLLGSEDPAQREEGAEGLRGLLEAEAGQHPWAGSAARRCERWLEAQGRYAELKTCRQRLKEIEHQHALAWQDFVDLDEGQRFEPHDLGPRSLRVLQDLLGGEPAVARVHVVRKLLRHYPAWRFCVVVIERASNATARDALWPLDLHERLHLPCPFLIVDLGDPYWGTPARQRLVQRLRAVPDSCVLGGPRSSRRHAVPA